MPKLARLGRVLVTSGQCKVGVKCKNLWPFEPCAFILEGKNLPGPAALAMQRAHQGRLLEALKVQAYLNSIETGHQQSPSWLPGSRSGDDDVSERFGALRLVANLASCSLRPRRSSAASFSRSLSSRSTCITRAYIREQPQDRPARLLTASCAKFLPAGPLSQPKIYGADGPAQIAAIVLHETGDPGNKDGDVRLITSHIIHIYATFATFIAHEWRWNKERHQTLPGIRRLRLTPPSASA